MHQWLKKWGSLCVFLLFWFGLTLPSLFSTSHFLYNLEPYPDGLLYALSGRNLERGLGLQLVYDTSTLSLWVPPLYPLVLAIGYVFSLAPGMFYLTNVVLGALTLILVWLTLKRTTRHQWAVWVGVALYLSHAYIWWLPTVPMTENLTLLLVAVAVYGLTSRKFSIKNFLVILGSGVGLLLTRYSAAPIAAVLVIGLLFFSDHLKKRQFKIGFWGLGVVGLMIVVGYLTSINRDPLALFQEVNQQLTAADGLFYSYRFVGPNIKQYVELLVGRDGYLLWLSYPLTSGVMAITWLVGTWFNIRQGTSLVRKRTFWLSLVFLAQFPLLLIFYLVDARYVIYSVLLWTIVIVWFIDALPLTGRERKIGLGVGILLLVIHLYSQVPLFKEIVVTNLLHRSRAWQYEAVMQFASYFQNQPGGVVITALPPFLVEAYAGNTYRVLPLSTHQEFLQHRMYVWGENSPQGDLVAEYQKRLQDGEVLYISNAYITHNPQVIADYEVYKQAFQLVPVASGCQQTCDLFQLKLLTN